MKKLIITIAILLLTKITFGQSDIRTVMVQRTGTDTSKLHAQIVQLNSGKLDIADSTIANRVTALNNAVVYLNGDQIINSEKRFNGQIVSGTNAYTSDPQIVISRTINNPSNNSHGFSDQSIFTTSGMAYDARGTMQGGKFDHYAGFQSAPTINITDTLSNLYGAFSLPTIQSGIVKNNYGFYLTRANVIGGSIINDYGLYINGPIAGTVNNFAIYTYGIAPSSFGGLIIGNKGLIGGDNPTIGGYVPTKQLEARSQSDLPSTIRISQAGYNNWDIKMPASSTSLVIGDVSGDYINILNGGKVGILNPSPAYPLDVNGIIASNNNSIIGKTEAISDSSTNLASTAFVKQGLVGKLVTNTSTLAAGTVTVSTTAVTATSRILVTVNTPSGTQGFLSVPTRTAGTSFVINSTSATETSTVDWAVIN